MIFEHGGNRYDTSDMEAYETPAMARFMQAGPIDHDDLCVLAVYLTRDHAQVFVLTADGRQGINIHRAEEGEVRHLADEHHLPVLLEAIR